MKDVRTSLCAYLPTALASLLETLSDAQWASVQDVRLRANAPLTVSGVKGNLSLGQPITAVQVRDSFVRLCDQAVHSHQEELRQGFITTRDGFRVGIAGTAVMRENAVGSYRDITSLCIRIPRVTMGCAEPLIPWIKQNGGVSGLLLCGAPASGKTTLLRDVAHTLSREYSVAVIDERRELAQGGLSACDVLCDCPKAIGILQAVRTLAPDVVIADEIGDGEEWQAITYAMFCGVPVIASVHAASEADLLARKAVAQVLRDGGFAHVAFLPVLRSDTKPMRIRKAAELFETDGSDLDRAGEHGGGRVRGTATRGHGTSVARMGTVVDVCAHRTPLYDATVAGDPCRFG